MRLVSALLTSVALVAILPHPGHAESTTNFRGLFAGIDPDDGSLIHLQISCDEGGLCTLRATDSFFSLCSAAEGRGLLEGAGRVEDGVLVVDDYRLSCADDSGLVVDTSFTPDPFNETLIEVPDDPDILPITYHRISRPLGLR